HVNTNGLISGTGSDCGAGGGSTAWGTMSGTLSDQSDLKAILDTIPTTATNIVALFGGGKCSGYLKSDGTCGVPIGGTSTQVLNFRIGSDHGPVLLDSDDESAIFSCEYATCTITKVTCKADAGNQTVQLQKDDSSPVNMFASNLTCSPTPSGSDGTAGILTSCAGGENVLVSGNWLNYQTIASG